MTGMSTQLSIITLDDNGCKEYRLADCNKKIEPIYLLPTKKTKTKTHHTGQYIETLL